MADEIERVMDEHFYKTPEGPSAYEAALLHEGLQDWDRNGDPVAEVISFLAVIDASPSEDIRSYLHERHYDREALQMGEEGPFDKDAYYAESEVSISELQLEWIHFEESLKSEARFFSRTAQHTLSTVFEGIHDHTMEDGKSAVMECGPGQQLTALYRARSFQSDPALIEAMKRPDVGIGPPPSKAASAGRMNARGVSVFYGATTADVCLAEVRPAVGSKVLLGRFEITRPLSLLDVEALESLRIQGSLFDRSFAPRLKKIKFLESLSKRISMPVLPDDEPFDYLATQAVADFLAAQVDPPLDGISYRSVQTADGAKNVVLFHKSARVERFEIPSGTKINATLYDRSGDIDQISCWVTEEVPPHETTLPRCEYTTLFSPGDSIALDAPFDEESDHRQTALRLETATVELHVVRAVAISADRYIVHRHHMPHTRNTPF